MRDERDEHEEARRLLTPLAGEPAAPSSVDVRRAIADGRRHLRTRRLTGVGAVAAVTALLVAGVPMVVDAARGAGDRPPAADPATTGAISPSPPSAPAPPTECELELLPEPAGLAESVAFGSGPTGRIVYGQSLAEVAENAPEPELPRPTLWIEGEPVPISIDGGAVTVRDVNSAGTAVLLDEEVTGEDVEGQARSWRYQDGAVTRLAGANVRAKAINEQGVIAGTRAGRTVPVVWPSPGSDPVDLPLPAGYEKVTVTDIADDGTVVAFAERSTGPGRALLWRPDHSLLELPVPELEWGPVSFPASSYQDGLVTAAVLVEDPTGDGRYRILQYDLATGRFDDLSSEAPLDPTSPLPWNRHGWLAGEASAGQAALWTPTGGLVPLPDLGNHDWFANLPASITDDGHTVVGTVTDRDWESHAATWHCR